MNLLHVVPTYYPATYWGGPIFSVYALNNALARMPNVNLKVLTGDAAGPDITDCVDVSSQDGGIYPNHQVIFTHRLAANSVSIELLLKLPSLIRWADVVHLTATYSFPTIPVLLLCRLLRRPVVWSHRGAILDTYKWPDAPRKRLKRAWELICNILIRRKQVVTHVTSEREQEAAQVRISKARAVIVPNGVDVPSALPVKDWCPAGKLRLIYLGRISQKKGIENLLHAVASLRDMDVLLTIYGTGILEYVMSMKQLAGDLGLNESTVNFAGHVDGIAKYNAFCAADICVVPSHSENFCMVVAEALAHAIPVIASHGTPWQEIEDKQCGLWVDNRPQSLAEAIVRMRSMPLEEMGRGGWRWMRDGFSWDSVASKMMSVYQDLIQQEEMYEK